MATVMKRRLLVNPAKKRKTKRRNASGRRKMTAKQIRFFGTARQKAALRGKRKTKRSHAHRANPKPLRRRPRKSAAPRRKSQHRARRKNVAEIITASLGALNPARKKRRKQRRNTVAKAKTRKKKSSARPRRRSSASRRANPARTRRSRRNRSHGHSRKRRNPGMTSGIGGMVATAGWVLAGAVGSRAITQFLLGGSNTGITGYGANAAAGLGLGFLVRKGVNTKAGNEVMIGTLVGLIIRAIQDFTPFGSYASLSGVGDLGMFLATDQYAFRTYTDSKTNADISVPNGIRRAIAAAAVPSGKGTQGLYETSLYS